MTRAAEILADEIARTGPIRFSRFMEVALYHPDAGYYRRARDPFGREGDFYTAEQVQPVFGRVIRAAIDQLFASNPELPRNVVELGAGREEMRDAFAGYTYLPIDVDRNRMPDSFSGVVFANEFFDALPVDVVMRRGGDVIVRRVDINDSRFVWVDAEVLSGTRLSCDVEDGEIAEISHAAQHWIDNIASMMDQGFVFVIDYGYTCRELLRFPAGTLMSYRRHRATEEVLVDPGNQDITAHVNFSALQDYARAAGFEVERFESLSSALLRAGEHDHFASALQGSTEAEVARNRLQLKSLLFGMGETFRVLVLRKKG